MPHGGVRVPLVNAEAARKKGDTNTSDALMIYSIIWFARPAGTAES